MKTSIIYIFFCVLFIFPYCTKVKDNSYLKVYINEYIHTEWANGKSEYFFDLDNDNIDDVKFVAFSYYSSFNMSEKYTYLQTLNGYKTVNEIAEIHHWQWQYTINGNDTTYYIDTILTPKIFKVGDVIAYNMNMTSEPVYFNYYWFPTGPGSEYSSYKSFSIPKGDDFFYVAIINEDLDIIAWLQLMKPVNKPGLILSVSKYTISENSIVIP